MSKEVKHDPSILDWRQVSRHYLGSFDLKNEAGSHKEITVTIAGFVVNEIYNQSTAKKEDKTVLNFAENIKPMILNIGNQKTIQALAKSVNPNDWLGMKIQIGVEPFRGDFALRVRKFPPKSDAKPPAQIIPCADCGETIKAAGGASVDQIITGTEKTYGAALCMDCAGKRKANG